MTAVFFFLKVIEVKGDGESTTRAEQGSELDNGGRRMSEIALRTWTIWRLWVVKWTNYNVILPLSKKKKKKKKKECSFAQLVYSLVKKLQRRSI